MADKVVLVGPLDRVLYLRTLPVFEPLGSEALAAIAQHARERFFRRGSTVLRPDRPAHAVFVVVDGLISIYRDARRVEDAGPGEAVGFLHLLSRTTEGIEARADVDTLTLELDWDAQLDVCEDHFPVLLQYVRYLSRRSVAELSRIADGTRLGEPHDAPFVGPRALNLVERILGLRRSRPFSRCSVDALSELARHVVEERLRAGQPIWTRGTPAGHLLLVVSGSVRCHVDPGRAFLAGPGVTLGMHEALMDGVRWYDVVTAEDLVGLRIDVEPLVDILEDHFEMAIDLTSMMAVRLMELMKKQ